LLFIYLSAPAVGAFGRFAADAAAFVSLVEAFDALVAAFVSLVAAPDALVAAPDALVAAFVALVAAFVALVAAFVALVAAFVALAAAAAALDGPDTSSRKVTASVAGLIGLTEVTIYQRFAWVVPSVTKTEVPFATSLAPSKSGVRDQLPVATK